METMSPQQQNELSRRMSLTGESKTSTQHEHKRRMKSLSHRRQSAPSLVINKALTRSKTFSRESFLVPVCPETCPLVQSFLCPDRAFLLHGHVTLKTGLQTQDRDFFLFTDVLIIAKSKSPTHFKMKAQVCVGEMWTAQCMEDVCEGSTNPERSFVIGWPTCNCVVTFSSEVQKERWLSMLKSRIKEEKEKDDPKTIPLKVFGKGIGSCAQAVSKTLGVSNSDSTNEVVRLALQQFGVTSCVKDYQLWVSSKRDNAPYPLIGHEFPFSIQMSHMREPLSQPGRRDTVPPPDRQRAMHRDQVQVDKQCQFILKTRCSSTTTTPVIVDPAQKPFKRRRSLINWAFWKGSNPNLHSSSTNLSSPAPGYLFGQSLSTICWDNSLPKPVMAMLVFLYNEGPFTRGIFRRSAGARACRELRDRLDSGAQDVPLTREHVFIIAAVFKDFLRNIPGSLLCSDLYEQWMDVMEEAESEEAEEEEQAQDITRLIGLLPKENALLLRHVVAVLHGIQENAHDNQMNAFNLSVCIAPSMLWAPGPSSPEVEGEGAKKVCDLVRYMIEHCQEVLGEDVTSVFGGLPRKRAESDVSSFHLTDSSYDSLENMLNDDSSESPCLHTSRRRWRAKPLQGSLDSVLTLSDCDLEQPDLDTDPDTTDPQSGNHHHRDTITQPGSGNLLQPSTPARGRTRKLSPAAPPSSCPSPPAPRRGGRRCSEPAIGYSVSSFVARLAGNADRRGSIDDLAGGGEMFQSLRKDGQTLGPTHTGEWNGSKGACEGSGSGSQGAQTRRRDASNSSLSSPPTSPIPTRSSVDSLDSLLSHSSIQSAAFWQPRAGPNAARLTPSPAPPGPPGPPGPPVPLTPISSPTSTHSLPIPTPAPGQGLSPNISPPKEIPSWGTLKGCRGLHPNTWLKRGRRLSLSQQEDEGGVVGSTNKTLPTSKSYQDKGGLKQSSEDPPKSSLASCPPKAGGLQNRGRVTKYRRSSQGSVSPPSRQRSQEHFHSCRSPCYQSTDRPLTVKELREIHSRACAASNTGYDVTNQGSRTPPQHVFFGQGGPSLSLARQKSHSLAPGMEGLSRGRCPQRRSSEPGTAHLGEALVLDKASHPERLHREAKLGQRSKSVDGSQDLGLKVSDTDRSGAPKFCLSPSATKAVRDYFSSHTHSNPHSGQQVALALIQGQRERLKRCSDPMLEPDFDQLLFAEESYV
ncbi:rho GTPase-activating protein 20 isoform X1 [Salmo salar]|uniref:Rho GTPase-activating protein 20 n=1 Tax=Salmo salar TaxID=8030 RepID=A0A1S3MWP6_SALSA|nr:rho GTPase-activating protein 20-like isoform X1 [Salmo salar]|eukprot:XP_014007648.1 PREDICTED: rho GTPase-activating protein 20-like isoform X1 [Salmo salar]